MIPQMGQRRQPEQRRDSPEEQQKWPDFKEHLSLYMLSIFFNGFFFH